MGRALISPYIQESNITSPCLRFSRARVPLQRHPSTTQLPAKISLCVKTPLLSRLRDQRPDSNWQRASIAETVAVSTPPRSPCHVRTLETAAPQGCAMNHYPQRHAEDESL